MKEILITSSVLIGVLLLLRVIFAKKVSRRLIYGAWILVALRLLIPVQIGQLDFSILTSARPMTEAITEVSNKQVAGVTEQDAYREVIRDYVENDQTVFAPEVQEHIQSAIRDDIPKEEIAVMIDKIYAEQEIFVPEVQQQVQQQVAEVADPVTLGQIATTVWLAGVAVMAVWFAVVNLRHGRMLRKNRETLDVESPIPVYVSEKVGSPCLVGLFRPAVYLTPVCAAEESTRRHVLTHELTHYRHKDHIWSVVRCVCLCVYWFNPLVWVAAYVSRRDCELACDEGALKRLGEEERLAYGKSLLDVVSHASRPVNLMQTATAMNETKKQLKERVNFIVKKNKISLIAGVAMILVCAIVAGCAAAGVKNGENSGTNSEGNNEELSAAETLQIQEDAVKYFSTKNSTCQPEDVRLRLISRFDDTYVMFVDMPFLAYTTAIEEEEINGLEFRYPDSQRMYVYENGSFTRLKEAFETGLLSAEQLKTVWEDYRDYKNSPPRTDKQPMGSTPGGDSEPMKWIQLLTKVENRNEVKTELRYDEQWNLKELDGNTKYRFEIDAVNRTMKVYLPEGGDFLQEEYQYNADGNPTMIKCYGSTAYTEEYFYDAEGKLLKEILSYEGPGYMAGQYWETVYTYYGETEKIKSQFVYTCYENSIGQKVRNETQSVFYSYDEWGNLCREDWYSGSGEKLQYVLYTRDASQRSEKREVFVERDTREGKVDVLEEMSILYYNTEGNVIRREEYQPSSLLLEHTYTYSYQTVQVSENFFAPKYVNVTERKVVFPDDDSQPTDPLVPQKVTYTVKAVDTKGDPVANVPIVTYPNLDDVVITNEDGTYQWQDYERETPFFAVERQMPKGYAYSGYTQDGNVYTILMRPIVTYTVKVLKDNGEPLVNADVWLLGSVDSDSTSTDVNGIMTISMPEDRYEVKVTNTYASNGEEIWTQRYEIPEGQTEATFTWVDDTVIYKVKVVDADGKPVANVYVDIYVENMDGIIPAERTDKNGEVTFKARIRKYIIWVYTDADENGRYVVLSYGTFEFPEGETEVVIVIGEPERIEMT